MFTYAKCNKSIQIKLAAIPKYANLELSKFQLTVIISIYFVFKAFLLHNGTSVLYW